MRATRTNPRSRCGSRGRVAWLTQPAAVAFLAGPTLCLTGCGMAPALTIAGAYFPAWLLCAIVAVVVAAMARLLMVVTGLSNRMPFQLAVCLSFGVFVALALWRLWVVY